MTIKQNVALFVLLFMCFSGCGDPNRPKDLPELIPCTLTLTQDGKPLDLAMLFFTRTDMPEGEKEWVFSAETNAQGVCEPQAIGRYPGLAEGTYKVRVSKVWMEPRNDLPTDIQDSLPMALEVNLVHAQYTDDATTPLEITVKKGETNVFSLTLDPPPAGTVIPDPSTWPSTKYRK